MARKLSNPFDWEFIGQKLKAPGEGEMRSAFRHRIKTGYEFQHRQTRERILLGKGEAKKWLHFEPSGRTDLDRATLNWKAALQEDIGFNLARTG